MRPVCASILALCLGAAPTSVCIGAGKTTDRAVSWGKAGVDLAQYRMDAVDCNMSGGLADIRDLEATTRFVQAQALTERNLNTPPPPGTDQLVERDRIRRSFNPERQIDRVAGYQLSTVEKCLRDRGYRAFRLTSRQSRMLSRYEKGTEGRHRYLHSLASDGDILSSQGL